MVNIKDTLLNVFPVDLSDEINSISQCEKTFVSIIMPWHSTHIITLSVTDMDDAMCEMYTRYSYINISSFG